MRTTFGSMTLTQLVVGTALALATSGCMIVSTDHLDELTNNETDAGPGDGGVVELEFDDRCSSGAARFNLVNTMENIEIDTAPYRSDNSSACSETTPGNDVFLGLEVQEGEFWHFHLAARQTTLRPMLYLTPASSCDSRNCEYVSIACSESGDEHFAFVADEPGRWYLGIDDGAEGGGEYLLSAYRPVCGDGMGLHGEACDDGNATNGDGCDRRCRVELSEDSTMEYEPNDNQIEANSLVLPVTNVLEITGNVGGTGVCKYADVFAVTVPEQGDLQVDALTPAGDPCASSALTPFRFVLENSARDTIQSGMQDTNMCAVIRATDLDAGEYFIRIEIPAETTVAQDYRMRVQILP